MKNLPAVHLLPSQVKAAPHEGVVLHFWLISPRDARDAMGLQRRVGELKNILLSSRHVGGGSLQMLIHLMEFNFEVFATIDIYLVYQINFIKDSWITNLMLEYILQYHQIFNFIFPIEFILLSPNALLYFSIIYSSLKF